MCNRHCLEAVERTLRDVMNNSFDFGYKAVLVSGDFRQILPVIPGGSRADIVEKCFKASPLYDKFNVLRLTENMRLAELRADPNADPEALEFPEFLLKVGEGRDLSADALGRIDLPSSVHKSDNIRELCHRVFEGLGLHYADTEWISQRAVITTKNFHLEEINTIVGAMIPGELRLYKSHDYVEAEDGQRIISEADNSASETAEHTNDGQVNACLLYTSPSPRDKRQSRMPSSA